MTKLKTHQATAKRFRVTKNGKIIKKSAGQGHFNARENGNTGRNKKSDVTMSPTLNRIIGMTLHK